jgi:Restriction endonuclease BglII
LYTEIESIIHAINANDCRTKVSKEKEMVGKMLLSPPHLNSRLVEEFVPLGWKESRYEYFITLKRELMEEMIYMDYDEQKQFLKDNGQTEFLSSYKQTDFVKNQIAVEIQFGKYAFVAFDLFVKHMLFYSGGKINLGVEVLPTKNMVREMSCGIGYFEGEVYNVMRHGRNNPPVPLLILGVEP